MSKWSYFLSGREKCSIQFACLLVLRWNAPLPAVVELGNFRGYNSGDVLLTDAKDAFGLCENVLHIWHHATRISECLSAFNPVIVQLCDSSTYLPLENLIEYSYHNRSESS